MHNQINWDYYYKYLKGIQDQFKTDLVNLVLNNFFPKHATYESVDEIETIIRFHPNFLKPKDKKKLLYSKKGLKGAINDRKYHDSFPLCEDHLLFFLSNYPPRFDFSISSEFGGPGNKKKRLDVNLDRLAAEYDLKHYRGNYTYKKYYSRNNEGRLYKRYKPNGFKKTYPGHVFKPKYEKGMDFKKCPEIQIAHK